MPDNPLANPFFLPSVRLFAVIFALGLVLVLFFARKDLRAGLKGELGQRYIGWLLIAPLFLLATFTGGFVGVAILLLFCARVTYEYVQAVGVERSYAIYLYALIPLTVATASLVPSLYFMLPAGSILLLTLVPILTRRVEDLYLQLSFAGRGYLYAVWSVGHFILLWQLAGPALVTLVGVGVALSDVMQYTVGKLFGRHIISPEVNPRKAWEGLIGDVIGASLAVALFNFALPEAFLWFHKLALAFLIGLGAAWGDLASSLVKRAAGTKDWGNVVPGHGGLFDRANSLVVVVPLTYYFAYLVLEYA